MTIHISQTVEEKSSRHWKWSVWLEGPSYELDGIQSVTYQLHSTFNKPIREVSDRQSGFRLDSSGWGQFMIYITLLYRDGTKEQRQHWLRFSGKAPSKELKAKFGEEFGDRPPTAFLSYSVADAVTALAVRMNLEDKGVSVLDASSLGVGENLSDGIENMIDRSDFGISIVSDVTSKWVNQESLQMQERKLPVFQIKTDDAPNSPGFALKVQPLSEAVTTDFSDLINSSMNLDKTSY